MRVLIVSFMYDEDGEPYGREADVMDTTGREFLTLVPDAEISDIGLDEDIKSYRRIAREKNCKKIVKCWSCGIEDAEV